MTGFSLRKSHKCRLTKALLLQPYLASPQSLLQRYPFQSLPESPLFPGKTQKLTKSFWTSGRRTWPRDACDVHLRDKGKGGDWEFQWVPTGLQGLLPSLQDRTSRTQAAKQRQRRREGHTHDWHPLPLPAQALYSLPRFKPSGGPGGGESSHRHLDGPAVLRSFL